MMETVKQIAVSWCFFLDCAQREQPRENYFAQDANRQTD
jgi:hypothetical protein